MTLVSLKEDSIEVSTLNGTFFESSLPSQVTRIRSFPEPATSLSDVSSTGTTTPTGPCSEEVLFKKSYYYLMCNKYSELGNSDIKKSSILPT